MSSSPLSWQRRQCPSSPLRTRGVRTRPAGRAQSAVPHTPGSLRLHYLIGLGHHGLHPQLGHLVHLLHHIALLKHGTRLAADQHHLVKQEHPPAPQEELIPTLQCSVVLHVHSLLGAAALPGRLHLELPVQPVAATLQEGRGQGLGEGLLHLFNLLHVLCIAFRGVDVVCQVLGEGVAGGTAASHAHTDSTYLQLVNDYLQIADFALAGHGLLLSTLEQLLQQRQSARRVGRGPAGRQQPLTFMSRGYLSTLWMGTLSRSLRGNFLSEASELCCTVSRARAVSPRVCSIFACTGSQQRVRTPAQCPS